MADEATNPTAANGNGQTGPQLTVQKIYIRDASFEAPGAPHIFQDQSQPKIELNLGQKVQQLAQDVYEVVLTLTVTCKAGDKTAYLVEVQQAGIFGLAGFDPQQLNMVIGTYCPHVIFPYARQAISSMIEQGGFPPFLLQPINFEQIYADQLKRRQQAA